MWLLRASFPGSPATDAAIGEALLDAPPERHEQAAAAAFRLFDAFMDPVAAAAA
jgi:hypothetical protein